MTTTTTSLNPAAMHTVIGPDGVKRNMGVDENTLFLHRPAPEESDGNYQARQFLKACAEQKSFRACQLFEAFPADYRDGVLKQGHGGFDNFNSDVAARDKLGLWAAGTSDASGAAGTNPDDIADGRDDDDNATTRNPAAYPTLSVNKLLFAAASIACRNGDVGTLRWLTRVGATDVLDISTDKDQRAECTAAEVLETLLPCPHPVLIMRAVEEIKRSQADVPAPAAAVPSSGSGASGAKVAAASAGTTEAQTETTTAASRRRKRRGYGHYTVTVPRGLDNAATKVHAALETMTALHGTCAMLDEDVRRQAVLTVIKVQGPAPVLPPVYGLDANTSAILRSMLQSTSLTFTQALALPALAVAALHNQATCVGYLRTEACAAASTYDEHAQLTAVACACLGGSPHIFALLLAEIPRRLLTPAFLRTCFLHACAHNHVGIMNELFVHADVCDDCQTGEALVTAARANATQSMKWLTYLATKTGTMYPANVLVHAFMEAATHDSASAITFLLTVTDAKAGQASGKPLLVADAFLLMRAFTAALSTKPVPAMAVVTALRGATSHMATRSFFVDAVALTIPSVVTAVIAAVDAQLWPLVMWMVRDWVMPVTRSWSSDAVVDSTCNVNTALAALQRRLEEAIFEITAVCMGTSADVRLVLWLKQVVTACWRAQSVPSARVAAELIAGSSRAACDNPKPASCSAATRLPWPDTGLFILSRLLSPSAPCHCPLSFFQTIAHAMRVDKVSKYGLPWLLQSAVVRNRLDVARWIAEESKMPISKEPSGAYTKALRGVVLCRKKASVWEFRDDPVRRPGSPTELVNKLPLLQYLRDLGVRMDACNSKLLTLFARAAPHNQQAHPHWTIVQWLASLPEINVKNRRSAALYYASRCGHEPATRALLRRGATQSWSDANKPRWHACRACIAKAASAEQDADTDQAIASVMGQSTAASPPSPASSTPSA